MTRERYIVITDRSHGLPYSKGLMASSLTVSGLSPARAFQIAEAIQEELEHSDRFEITSRELRDLAAEHLFRVDEKFASTYLKWQDVEELDAPMVILLGGATGVGKSTVATQLAARLGITRVISTDAIREVLRSALSSDFMPVLHVSSFNADLIEKTPLLGETDRVLVGFTEQVKVVAVGIKALIARAEEEGTDMIIEGAHVVPGFLEGWQEEFNEVVIIPIVMTVGPEELHRSHFHMRSLEQGDRPQDRYLPSFDKIRMIQSHILKLASEHDVPVVEAFDIDSTLKQLVGIVVEKALQEADPPQPDATKEVVLELKEGKKPQRRRMKNKEVLGRRNG